MAAWWLFFWLLGNQFTPTVTIEGVVVRAGTNQPLADQQVGLWPTPVTARTNALGNFAIPNVAPGRYDLIAVRDGVRTRLPIIPSAGQRPQSVRFEVRSAPAISGSVFDANGERAAAVRVQAYRMTYLPTGPRIRTVMSVLTDDLGDYRLYRLRPGTYYVSADINERDRQVASSGLQLPPNLVTLDDGLPTTFYGGGSNPSLSRPVSLSSDSDAAAINLFAREGPRFSLNGTIIAPGGSACVRVAVVPEGGIVSDADFQSGACGSFRIPGLSPGTYFVLAAAPGLASDVVPVNIQNRDAEAAITMVPTVTIPGRLDRDAGVTAPAGARVILSRNSRDISQRMESVIETDGTFAIRGVGPGRYDVFVERLPESSYLRSVRYQGADAMLLPLAVGLTSPGVLFMQLGRSSIVAAGVVLDTAGRPAPGAEVVLVPRTYRNREDRFLTATADAAGNFRIASIPPGTYTAFAFEEIEPGAYFAFSYDNRLLNDYSRRGTVLNLDQTSGAALRLTVVPAADTAGGLR